MLVLVLGLILFFAVHSISIVDRRWRDRMVERLGAGGWRGLYSLAALVGLVLMIWGYGLARQEPIIVYAPPLWLRDATLILMLPVFPLLLAAYLPGGIKAAVKHPLLLAVKIWALAHLLSNGGLHDVLLFGAFMVWAGVDRASIKRRQWALPPPGPRSTRNDVVAVLAGLGLYAWFALGGHSWLFGVPASPWRVF